MPRHYHDFLNTCELHSWSVLTLSTYARPSWSVLHVACTPWAPSGSFGNNFRCMVQRCATGPLLFVHALEPRVSQDRGALRTLATHQSLQESCILRFSGERTSFSFFFPAAGKRTSFSFFFPRRGEKIVLQLFYSPPKCKIRS